MEKEKRIVYYIGSGQWDGMPLKYKEMTTINIAFVTLNENGHLIMRGEKAKLWEQEYFKKLSDGKKENSNLRINLSAGGWGARGFSKMASTRDNRKIFIDDFLAFIEKYDLDGVDLDWEYPVVDGNEIEENFNKTKKSMDWDNLVAMHWEDKSNFTLLIKELRKALDKLEEKTKKYYEISFAAGAQPQYLTWIETDKVAQLVDFVKLMTYDNYTIWNKTTGHHACLYNNSRASEDISVEKCVNNYIKAGFKKEQIVLGVPFYGRGWSGVRGGVQNGIYEKFEKFAGAPSYHEIEAMVAKGDFKKYWDEESKAPYIYNGDTIYSYEDKKSLSEKINYLKKQDLAGIMIWEYSLDSTQELVHHIYKEMVK